jgi:hypothetical protein
MDLISLMIARIFIDISSMCVLLFVKLKGKFIPIQAVEALRVARG